MRLRQVCDHCGGPFGMVTYRSWGGKFCKRRCKDAFLREIMHGCCGSLKACRGLFHRRNRREVAVRPSSI